MFYFISSAIWDFTTGSLSWSWILLQQVEANEAGCVSYADSYQAPYSFHTAQWGTQDIFLEFVAVRRRRREEGGIAPCCDVAEGRLRYVLRMHTWQRLTCVRSSPAFKVDGVGFLKGSTEVSVTARLRPAPRPSLPSETPEGPAFTLPLSGYRAGGIPRPRLHLQVITCIHPRAKSTGRVRAPPESPTSVWPQSLSHSPPQTLPLQTIG